MRTFNWTELRKKLPERRFFRRWNLEYTKRVLASDPHCAMAKSLVGCWPARVQAALRSRFNVEACESV